jgi:hypothetical protein
MSILPIFLILILLLSLCKHNSEFFNNIAPINKNKPYLWSYWEHKSGKTQKPTYIDLCFKTFHMHCKNSYNIIILNEKTVLNYLPHLRTDINKLGLAQKSDYIRISLLYQYGGLWLDADTIIMNDLSELKNKMLEGWDFLGFGCTGMKCTNGYGFPSNQILMSRKNGILMKYCLYHLDNTLNNYFKPTNKLTIGYFDLGKHILWKQIKVLNNLYNYKYYHYSSAVDGARDVNGKWISLNLVTHKSIPLLDESKLMIVFLVNSHFCGKNPLYNWICDASEWQILNSKFFISYLFNKSLKNQSNYLSYGTCPLLLK